MHGVYMTSTLISINANSNDNETHAVASNTSGQAVSQASTDAFRRTVTRTIEKRSFCTLATTSSAGYAHVAGVVYEFVDGTLWVHASNRSRKVRNIVANPKVAICISYRRLPVGPPFTIHFQAHAEMVEMDSPEATALLDSGALGSISGHGALEMDDGCFVAIRPNRTVHTFGPGVRIRDLIRDPLGSGARSLTLTDDAPGVGR